MASTHLFLDTDYDTDGRSLSRQENTQSRSSGRNVLTVARRNGSAQSGGMLEGMESSPRVDDHQSNDRNEPVRFHPGVYECMTAQTQVKQDIRDIMEDDKS